MDFNSWKISNDGTEDNDINEPGVQSSIYIARNESTQADWGNFEESLKKISRVFISGIPTIIISPSEEFYRGRPCCEGTSFENVKDLKSPPAHLAGAGRINPAGLPFLYVADSIDTVLREVHQEAGTPISLVKCSPNRELKVLDLTHGVEEDEKEHSFRKIIDDSFSKPVDFNNTVLEYLPTQVVALYIKDYLKLDGVKYKSSVYAGGINLVVFDDNNMNYWILKGDFFAKDPITSNV